MSAEPTPKQPEPVVQGEGEAAPKDSGAAGEAKPASELTPEEQMERFEKELKETDWGHQPC